MGRALFPTEFIVKCDIKLAFRHSFTRRLTSQVCLCVLMVSDEHLLPKVAAFGTGWEFRPKVFWKGRCFLCIFADGFRPKSSHRLYVLIPKAGNKCFRLLYEVHYYTAIDRNEQVKHWNIALLPGLMFCNMSLATNHSNGGAFSGNSVGPAVTLIELSLTVWWGVNDQQGKVF